MDKAGIALEDRAKSLACTRSLRPNALRITAVKGYVVSIPMRSIDELGIAPFVSSQATTTHVNKTLVRITCQGGAEGWGEIPTKLPPQLMLSLLENELAGRIIGQSAMDAREVFRRTRYTIGRDRIEMSIFAAGLEVACWDAVGRALNLPVHALMGTKRRESVPACFYMGIVGNDDAIALARWGIGHGYGAMKLKIGLDLQADKERIALCREVGGDAMDIRVDANQSMSRESAICFLDSVDALRLQYIEQPLPIGAYEDYRHLRSAVGTCVAINEDCFLPNGLTRAIEADAIDAAVVELDSSGISGLLELAQIAHDASIPLAHHCSFDLGLKTAAVLHATCTRPEFSYAMDTVYPFLADDILSKPLEIRDGSFLVPNGPGWGVDVCMEKVSKYLVD